MALFASNIITSDSALGSAIIKRSLRFNTADTTYLNRTPSSASNRKTWTWSSWVKRDQVSAGTNRYMFMAGQTDGNDHVAHISFDNNDRFRLYSVTGSFDYKMRTNHVYRDTSAWYHVMVTFDTTQATASNRIKLYVNGAQITDLGQSDYPSQNHDSYFNNNVLHNIGRYNSGSTQWFEGYMAEINFIDGYAYDSSYFGFTDPQTGIWMPKRYEGTYGTNGFYLDFSDNSSTAALGIDKSPNGNDWTPNNFSVSTGYGNDSSEDAPSNNFCILNDNDQSSAVIRNGGLEVTQASDPCRVRGTFAMPPNTGKYYYEMEVQTGSSYSFGMKSTLRLGSGTSGNEGRYTYYGYDGKKQDSSSGGSSYGASYGAGDTVAILYDSDSGEVYFYKNGASQGLAFTGVNTTDYQPFVYLDNYGTAPIVHFNFGQRPFKYTLPIGAKKLNSVSLLPNNLSIIRPQKHFETLTYTGTGSSNIVEGLEFSPDMVWVKGRETAGTEHAIIDSVRGGTKSLITNDTDAESTHGGRSMTFYPNGVRWNSDSNICNANGEDYVLWCWKGGGAAVSNSDGTITSSISVNQEAGFSIVSYTGNGTAGATVGHGLNKKPAWIILIRRDSTGSRYVYHQFMNQGSNPEQHFSELNFHAGSTDSNNVHNDTAPTTSVFSLSNNNASNGNTYTYIAYCWAEIPGYSKFGEYRANGIDNNGPYVYLGFRPAWIMLKSMSLSNSDWTIFDNKRNTVNPTNTHLAANQSHADATDTYEVVDFLADGFRVTGLSGSGINYNTGYPDMIYMAFAEQPGTTPFDTFPNGR